MRENLIENNKKSLNYEIIEKILFSDRLGGNKGNNKFPGIFSYPEAGVRMEEIAILQRDLHASQAREIMLQSELEESRAEVQDLRRTLSGQAGTISDLESQVRVARLEKLQLEQQLRAARAASFPGASGEPFAQFLASVSLTTDKIRRMIPDERARMIARLERQAAQAFHPQNGISPDEARLKEINKGLLALRHS
jgi:hypothetical protein